MEEITYFATNQVLLDRSINIAARDLEGSTARDYIDIHDIEDRDVIRQLIDNHVMDLVSKDLHDRWHSYKAYN